MRDEYRRWGFDAGAFALLGSAGRVHTEPRTPRQLADLSVGLELVDVTPLHAALLAAVVANDGRLAEPRLVTGPCGPLGLTSTPGEPATSREVLEPSVARRLRRAMEAVARSGTGAYLAPPEFEVAMKTGTAAERGQGYHVNYIGMGPLPGAPLAFCVRVTHEPTSPAVTTAARAVTRRLLEGARQPRRSLLGLAHRLRVPDAVRRGLARLARHHAERVGAPSSGSRARLVPASTSQASLRCEHSDQRRRILSCPHLWTLALRSVTRTAPTARGRAMCCSLYIYSARPLTRFGIDYARSATLPGRPASRTCRSTSAGIRAWVRAEWRARCSRAAASAEAHDGPPILHSWNPKARSTSVSDDELLRRLGELVSHSRRVEVDLVSHIGEVEERRLYAREAFPSMFAYCTEVLHLSEAEAYLRITVARAAREHPLLLTMLGDGRLHLSGIAKLAADPHPGEPGRAAGASDASVQASDRGARRRALAAARCPVRSCGSSRERRTRRRPQTGYARPDCRGRSVASETRPAGVEGLSNSVRTELSRPATADRQPRS